MSKEQLERLHKTTHALMVGVALFMGLVGAHLHGQIQTAIDVADAVCQEVEAAE